MRLEIEVWVPYPARWQEQRVDRRTHLCRFPVIDLLKKKTKNKKKLRGCDNTNNKFNYMQVMDTRVEVGCLAPSPTPTGDFFMGHFCVAASGLVCHHRSRVHPGLLVDGHWMRRADSAKCIGTPRKSSYKGRVGLG